MANNRARKKIVGDVVSTGDVRIDGAGKTLRANLRAALANHLGQAVMADYSHGIRKVEGASLRFGDGQPLLLLSGITAGDKALVVRRTGTDKFEIARQTSVAPVEVDPIEAAFLRLRVKDFTDGTIKLGAPQSASAWGKTMRKKLSSTREALAKARRQATV